AYVLGAPSAFRLLSRVGEGDISALGCGLTGSCSSTFQCYSLGNHLGVTASPQFPLPAGYVTLPVDDRSPPLGLMPLTAGGTAFFKSSFLNAFQSYAPRTIRDEAHCRSRQRARPGPAARSPDAAADRDRCGAADAARWSSALGRSATDRSCASAAGPVCGRHTNLDGADAAPSAWSHIKGFHEGLVDNAHPFGVLG